MYCVKIEEIFDAMSQLAHQVLPENRRIVNGYVEAAWRRVGPFARSIEKDEEGTPELRSRFEPYVAAEETRLRRNFEAVKYQIRRRKTGNGDRSCSVLPFLALC